MHSDQWGKDYAIAALNNILDFGFDILNLQRIQAGSAVGNIGSIKVLEKAGMMRMTIVAIKIGLVRQF